ncbi:MAG TPA: hypothetical protein VLC91_04890, partial [Spongiibacteraceae bacterium]|nr:hypothetical protein [Spongiibacteraceae bacterium]
MRVATGQAPAEHRKGLLCAIASVVLVSIAQLAMRFGMAQVAIESLRALDSWSELSTALLQLSPSATLLPVIAGMLCYAVSVFCWMAALGRLPLNLA